MAVDHVKSPNITNLDSFPVVQNTAGEGAQGVLRSINGYATAVAASSVGATYQLVRVPSTVKVKRIFFESEAQGAGKFDVGVFYATDGGGGQPTSLLVANAIDADFFASAIDCTSLVAATDITNESTTYSLDKRDMPLWQALGLTSDPRVNFDIVASVITTAVTTGTGKFGIQVQFVD